MQRLSLTILVIAFFAIGCRHIGNKPDEDVEPTVVDMRVAGLKDEDAQKLEKELGEISGVKDVRRDPFANGATVFTFEYSGGVDDLRSAIDDIEYPGLRPGESTLRLQYEGFDNRAPKITVLSPDPDADKILTEKTATVVVQIDDEDVEEVTVNDVSANSRKKKGIYEADVELKDGENKVKIIARDEAGNESHEEFDVEVDTTPPDVEATVKVVVEGKVDAGSTVFVDGKEADVNMFGKWRIELQVKKGQRTVEVVAIDEAGNKKTEQKDIGL